MQVLIGRKSELAARCWVKLLEDVQVGTEVFSQLDNIMPARRASSKFAPLPTCRKSRSVAIKASYIDPSILVFKVQTIGA